jgi:flagellar hook-associated protein 3 FlgL
MQVDPNYIKNLVGSLNNATATEEQLTNQLSSGLGVTSLASDPAAGGAEHAAQRSDQPR